jgi:hypothetical protein
LLEHGVGAFPRGRRCEAYSLASLLFAEQTNPAEIAEHMGHSLQMLLSTYVHVIEELRGRERVSAEEEIRAARAELVVGDVAQTLPAETVAASAHAP